MALRDDRQIHQIFQSKDAKFYNHDLVREIETFRKTFNGVLFIDRVLGALGLAKGKIYPPRGEDGLKSLHAHITSSTLSSHHKLSILYYLLLDHDDAVAGGGDSARSHSHSHSRSSSQRQRQQHHDLLAEPFAASSGLPRKYAILMKGLWHMDRGQFPLALEHLAHPSLATTPEFADDIVSVLVRHASSTPPPMSSSLSLQGSQDGDGHGEGSNGHGVDYSLALAYFHTVRPVLRDPEALSLLFGALAATSVTEALYFSRSYPPPARRQLFEQLVASVVEDGGGGGSRGGAGSPSSSRKSELVSLAFDDVEDGWFRQYLGSGEGKKLKDARQVLAARRALHQDMGV